MTYRERVSREIVHKSKEGNIFVSMVRALLPRFIEPEIMNHLAEAERNYLGKYYWPFENNKRLVYVLRTVTSGVKKEIERYLLSTREDDEGHVYLKKLMEGSDWGNDDCSSCYLDSRASEVIETKVLSILKLRELHISDGERSSIFEVLKTLENSDYVKKLLDNLHYGRMVVDPEHPFFFEHPNEHVPGMMVMEAVRQFGIASSHLFGKIPPQGIHYILSDLEVHFKGYLELNYPVKFEGYLEEKKCNKDGDLVYSDYVVKLYQKNEELALTRSIGKNLPPELFAILRRSSVAPGARFCPRPGTKLSFSLFRNSRSLPGIELKNISLNGFCIKSFGYPEDMSYDSFTLATSSGVFAGTPGTFRKVWEKKEGDVVFSGFEIINISIEDRKMLIELLKLYFLLKEDREVL